MWTPTTREQHSRKALRYQTDLTDAEWVVMEPHLPPAHGTGRPRSWPMREIVNGIFYVMRAGCPWRLLPSDLPPWGTIYRWLRQVPQHSTPINIISSRRRSWRALDRTQAAVQPLRRAPAPHPGLSVLLRRSASRCDLDSNARKKGFSFFPLVDDRQVKRA